MSIFARHGAAGFRLYGATCQEDVRRHGQSAIERRAVEYDDAGSIRRHDIPSVEWRTVFHLDLCVSLLILLPSYHLGVRLEGFPPDPMLRSGPNRGIMGVQALLPTDASWNFCSNYDRVCQYSGVSYQCIPSPNTGQMFHKRQNAASAPQKTYRAGPKGRMG